MMNAHVVAYYWNILSVTRIEKASDAWAAWWAMSMHKLEMQIGARL